MVIYITLYCLIPYLVKLLSWPWPLCTVTTVLKKLNKWQMKDHNHMYPEMCEPNVLVTWFGCATPVKTSQIVRAGKESAWIPPFVPCARGVLHEKKYPLFYEGDINHSNSLRDRDINLWKNFKLIWLCSSAALPILSVLKFFLAFNSTTFTIL